MTGSPLFTVLVPVYNHARYVGAALDSLLAQTDQDWEAVIVNDGSTDATPEILEDYARRDARFRVFHKQNGGVATALNRGLREARGEWICWLSSDDLFDPRKLEIHRAGILRHPEGRFFCSHFKTLEEPSGTLEEPPLWAPIPEPQWQVLEMLRCIFVQGNSICVQREAWSKVGWFDETMRYGQDYDLFLRLTRLFPAVFIPERTCIQRHHAGQGSHTFREACFFDSGKAAISFLNRHSFSELFPLVDLTELRTATQALEKALDVAANPDALVYGLGPHPALLFRIMEWIWGYPSPTERAALIKRFRSRAQAESLIFRGTPLGLLWKVAAAASEVQEGAFAYQQMSSTEVGEWHCWDLQAQRYTKAEPLRKYLKQFDGIELPEATEVLPGANREIVLVCQKGAKLGFDQYGAMRVTLEVAKRMQRAGRMVLLVGLADQSMGLVEGLLFVAARNDTSLERVIARLGYLDAVVGIARGDIMRVARTQRAVIYQLGPHPPIGVPAKVINETDTPVCCVSHDSADAQVRFGIRPELLHVIYPGYDPHVFSGGCADRPLHSVMYAGNVIAYKGVDIALQAFRIVKQRFPDATFDIHGRAHPWRGVRDHCLAEAWFSGEGELDWEAIERDLPGCHYRGHVSLSELVAAYQTNSILVLPSREGDTFGLVSVEAQACGCIPVLPDNGCGFGETMLEGVTGHLYGPNTSESLAAKIVSLWEVGRPTVGERTQAQAWGQSTFSWEKAAGALINVIESAPAWKGNWRVALQCVLHETRGQALSWAFRQVPGARRLRALWRRLRHRCPAALLDPGVSARQSS
jgi:glycosyltransferase involved in cell wall biosynthesis